MRVFKTLKGGIGTSSGLDEVSRFILSVMQNISNFRYIHFPKFLIVLSYT